MKMPKFKTDFIQYILIGALALLLILSNFSIVAQFLGRLNPLGSYQRQIDELKGRVLLLEFDRVRIEDVSNLLLALQDFNLTTDSFPQTLDELKEKGYLDKNQRLTDPGTNKPYFYQNRGNDFVLCVWLSDMIKGVNTNKCPATSETSGGAQASSTQAVSSEPAIKTLEIVGGATVNVREKPTTDSAIVAKVLLGNPYSYTDTQDNWYHIIVNSEKRGWVRKDYIRLISEE